MRMEERIKGSGEMDSIMERESRRSQMGSRLKGIGRED
jgi:hypothetical protein